MGIYALFGFYALLSQTLLLREVSQVFGAHELALAGALAAWLLWTAAGALAAHRTSAAAAAGARAFPAAFLACAILSPASILAARLAPEFLPAGLQPGLFLMLAGPLLLTLPAAFANGLACGLALSDRPWRFYAAEAGGAAAAGLLTLAYFHYFPAFGALWLLALPALALAAYCAFSWRGVLPRLLAAGAAAGALILALTEPQCWRLRPPAARPAEVVHTSGGRLFKTGDAGLVYEDGRLLYAKEDAAAEELVHLPLLALRKPGKVLFAGPGAFFAAGEAAKHGFVPEIAEPDRFRAAYLAPQSGKNKVLPLDFRALPPDGAYDAFFLVSPGPENAALNRDFTLEAFKAARGLLRPGGLLVFSLPFPANYVPPAAAYTLASVINSLKVTFPHVELLPGARLTVIASGRAIPLDPATLTARYTARKIKTITVVPSAFPFMLHPYRRAWAAGELTKVRTPQLNTDLYPLAYFAYWRAWFSMVASPGTLLGLAALLLGGLCAGLALAGRLRFNSGDRSGEAFFIGFWAMALETALLLAFQAKTGRLAPELGALFAVFMAAAAAGAALPLKPYALPIIETVAAALALGAGYWSGAIFAEGGTYVWGLIAAAGLLSGAFFPPAAGKNGAAIYGWDLLGGAAGGFAAAAFAVPLLGIKGALYLAALAAFLALSGWVYSKLRTS